MSRQNIFEILDSAYDLILEMNKIRELFSLKMIKNINGLNYRESMLDIEEFVDVFLLHLWKQRKSFLSIQEIREYIFSSINYEDLDKPETILKTLEYYLNLINLIEIKNCTKNHNNQFYREFWLLKENIDILLDHLNHEKLIIAEEEKLILVPRNPAATAVAEISSEDTALAILKYNHASLKGNLESKRKLLYQISLEYEPLLKAPIEGYKDFYEKTNALLNTLHIRHNNTQKENNKNSIIDICDEELEKWYDELYQLLLFCVLIKDNLDRKKEVDEFLKSIKEVKNS